MNACRLPAPADPLTRRLMAPGVRHWRSITSNSEVTAVAFGEDVGAAMASRVRTDPANANRVTPAAGRARLFWQRCPLGPAGWRARFW